LNIPEKDTLRFWYKVSSEEDYDFFNFQADSVLLIHVSGEADWDEAEIILDKGVHLLQWIYDKDGSVSNGSDGAFLDFVRFPLEAFIKSAICLNKISAPEEGKSYQQEILEVELTNLGLDTVSTVSLEYIVNEDMPVNENFNTEILPGDTIKLSFSQTIDMTESGTYNIQVYTTSPDNYFINDTLKLIIVSTGIGDIILNDGSFIIAPNPVTDRLRILSKTEMENAVISVFNSSGILIYRENRIFISAGEQVVLNHDRFARGTYFIIIRNSKASYLYKFVKL